MQHQLAPPVFLQDCAEIGSTWLVPEMQILAPGKHALLQEMITSGTGGKYHSRSGGVTYAHLSSYVQHAPYVLRPQITSALNILKEYKPAHFFVELNR